MILCARNDGYMGNSLWRLETALNYVAHELEALGRTHDVEVLVADWGSEIPLRDVVRLSEAAAAITSFLFVPSVVIQAVQQDSIFAEVIALNAAARRARGVYIGRIDQDTLVGKRFLAWLFDCYDRREQLLDVPLDSALLFSNRRTVPFWFASMSPSLSHVQRLITLFGRRLDVLIRPGRPFWANWVGIWLVHRDRWRECGGYDERMLYMNDMETNMITRLAQRHAVVDLGVIVGFDFYHLEHKQPGDPRATGERRRTNDAAFRRPTEFVVNDEHWGLAAYDLPVEPARVRSAGGRDERELVTSSVTFVAHLLAAGIQAALDRTKHLTIAMKMRQFYQSWRRRGR